MGSGHERRVSTCSASLAPLVDGRIAEFITDLDIPVDPRAALRARHPILKRRFDLIIDTQRYLGRTLFLRRIPHDRFISGTWRYLFSNARPPRGLSRRPPRLTDKLLGLAAAATGHEIPVPNPIPCRRHCARVRRNCCRQARPTSRWRPVRGSSTRENAGRSNPLSPWLGSRWNAAACRCFLSVPTNSTGAAPLQEAVPEALFPEQQERRRHRGRGPRPEPGRGTGRAGVGGGLKLLRHRSSAGRRRRANGFALWADPPGEIRAVCARLDLHQGAGVRLRAARRHPGRCRRRGAGAAGAGRAGIIANARARRPARDPTRCLRQSRSASFSTRSLSWKSRPSGSPIRPDTPT